MVLTASPLALGTLATVANVEPHQDAAPLTLTSAEHQSYQWACLWPWSSGLCTT